MLNCNRCHYGTERHAQIPRLLPVVAVEIYGPSRIVRSDRPARAVFRAVEQTPPCWNVPKAVAGSNLSPCTPAAVVFFVDSDVPKNPRTRGFRYL
jgi:hypothetical protein